MEWGVPAREIGAFTMRPMRSQDAQGVVNLYREIYGDHYPIREIYDPEFILKQHEKGLMVRAVVVDAGQNVLGTQAL